MTRKHNYKIPNSEERGQRSAQKMKALNKVKKKKKKDLKMAVTLKNYKKTKYIFFPHFYKGNREYKKQIVSFPPFL